MLGDSSKEQKSVCIPSPNKFSPFGPVVGSNASLITTRPVMAFAQLRAHRLFTVSQLCWLIVTATEHIHSPYCCSRPKTARLKRYLLQKPTRVL